MTTTRKLDPAKLQDWKQMAFNGAWRGLRWQRFKRAVTSDGTCVLQTRDGRRCAVGWLISLEKAAEAFQCSVEDLRGQQLLGTGNGLLADALVFQDGLDATAARHNFLVDLRSTHDRAYGPRNLERRLRSLAKRHGLYIPS